MLPIKLTSKTTPQQAAAVTHAARQAAHDVPWPLLAACLQRVTKTHTLEKAIARALAGAKVIPADASADWIEAFSSWYGRTQTTPAAKARDWATDYVAALAALQPVTAPPAPPEVRKYRQQQPLLFHRYKELVTPLVYTNKGKAVDTGLVRYNNGVTGSQYRFGPTRALVCGNDMWPWVQEGGDWLDADGVLHGHKPFATVTWTADTLPSAASTHRLDVSRLLQKAYDEDRWIAMLLRIEGTVWVRTPGSLEKDRARVEVEYTDGAVETLQSWVVASLVVNTTATTAMDPYCEFSGLSPLALEFYPPASRKRIIKAATLVLPVTMRYAMQGTPKLGVNLCAPPLPDLTPQMGAAAAYKQDAGISAMPGYVMHMALITDSTRNEDVIDVEHCSYQQVPYVPGQPIKPTQHVEGEFDPKLWANDKETLGLASWPTEQQRLQKLPHRSVGKWVGMTSPDRLRVVHSDDAQAIADGFAPLAPGLGALQVVMPGDGIASGQMWLDGVTKSVQDVKMYFPAAKIGRVKDLYMRYYVRLGAGYEPSAEEANRFHLLGNSTQMGKCPEDIGVPWSAGATRSIDRMGKWFGGAGQQTTRTVLRGYDDPLRIKDGTDRVWVDVPGGNGESAGTAGHSGRFWAREGVMDPEAPGPASGGLSIIFGPQDYRSPYHSIESHRPNALEWSTGWQTAATRFGGIGHLYPFHWYCLEFRFKANTVLPYELPQKGEHFLNAGFKVDGKVEFWIDGVKAGMSPDWAFRSGRMIDWALQKQYDRPFGTSGAMRAMTNVPLEDYMGFAHLIGDPYYGGKTPNPRRKVMWINGLVVTDGTYIGPMGDI